MAPETWRKSSACHADNARVEVAPVWRISTRSGGGGCVEVASVSASATTGRED